MLRVFQPDSDYGMVRIEKVAVKNTAVFLNPCHGVKKGGSARNRVVNDLGAAGEAHDQDPKKNSV